MNIRHADISELDLIMQIYRTAKAYMDATGNDTQWEVGYPSEDMIREDILARSLYVIEENAEIHAAFYFHNGEDELYRKIYDGAWCSDAPYGVIHRVASDGVMHGVVGACVAFAAQSVPNLRIDTHKNNHTMQRALEKCGFVQCGTVYLPNGDARIAYQLCR